MKKCTQVGDIIKIIRMFDDNGKDPSAIQYNDRVGLITHIDSLGQLHGSWGGLAVIPEKDEYKVLTPCEAIEEICFKEDIDNIKDILIHTINAKVNFVDDHIDDCCWISENEYVMERLYDITIQNKTYRCCFRYADYEKKVEDISILAS